jgi:DNA-binding CsgD family transcriptional regulator
VLLARAEPDLLTPLERAEAQRVRGTTLVHLGPFVDAPLVFATAARVLEPIDPGLARDTWLEALDASFTTLSHTRGITMLEIAQSALAAPDRSHGIATLGDLLLEGVATRIAVGHSAAVAPLSRALAAAAESDSILDNAAQRAVFYSLAVNELWDVDAGRRTLSRLADFERSRGGLIALRLLLHALFHNEVWAGRFAEAQSYFDEAIGITEAVGGDPFGGLMDFALAAVQGNDERVQNAISVVRPAADAIGYSTISRMCDSAVATAAIARGRYEEAFKASLPLFEEDAPGFGSQILPDIVESAARSGNVDVAKEALVRFSERAQASGTPWALGLLARSCGVVQNDNAEGYFEESIAHLDEASTPLDLYRSRLVYGEWLRRQRQRVASRDQLQLAFDGFTALGANGFAERAAIELKATGARARRRVTETRNGLTPQEEQVVRLAAKGATNREIAAELYLSESTVAYHLGKVYRKLSVSSRRQLSEHQLKTDLPKD